MIARPYQLCYNPPRTPSQTQNSAHFSASNATWFVFGFRKVVPPKTVNDQLQFDDEAISITLRRAWDRALRSLAARVNKPTFETHIRAIKPLGMNDETVDGRMHCNVILGMPSAFTREWVEKRHATLIAQVLEEILDCDVRLKFQLTPRGEATETTPVRHAPSPQIQRSAANPPNHIVLSQPPVAFGDLFGGELAPQPELAAVGAVSFAVPHTAPDVFAETSALSRTQTPLQSAPVSPARVPSARPNTRPGTGSDKSSTRPVSAASAATGGDKSANRWEATDSAALNARYTFDTFVVGQSNRLAQAGAQAVAQAPGAVYNPLFLYGPSGLGKTHLMHAIGNEIIRNQGINPARVAFVSGESFTTHFIASLRTGKAEDFRRKWRSVDLWLVDDIQFIAGKESTKEEFFHTFNALYQMGKQIVISSDRSPRELRTMDERLRSRFECGLIADIAAPDLETRLAILHKKAETEQARIPDDVLLYMAQLVQSNIRTLEGALVKLIAYASLVNSPVTTQLASSVLERYYIAAGIGDAHARVAQNGSTGEGASEAESPLASMAASFAFHGGMGATITPELVQQVVAKHFNISTKDLAGKKRDKDTSAARHVAIHLMRELTELTLLDIGKAFGGRDHSTVMYSVDKMKTQLEADEATKRTMNELLLQLRAQAPA